MNPVAGRRTWVKLWVNDWLEGTTRYQMSDGQRAFWIDLLAMAGRSRIGGIVCSGKDGDELIGYPLSKFQGLLAEPIDVEETFALFERTGKITLRVSGEGTRKLYVVSITNWARYQSEYERTKKYQSDYYQRKKKSQSSISNSISNSISSTTEVEVEVEVEGEREREREVEKTPAAKTTPPADNRHSAFVDFAYKAFEGKNGQKPSWVGKDFKALSTLLDGNKDMSTDELERRFTHYLASSDPFITKQGDSLQYFCNHVDSFMSGPLLATARRNDGKAAQSNVDITLEGYRQLHETRTNQ